MSGDGSGHPNAARRFAFPLAVVAAFAAIAIFRPPVLRTSLYEMAGEGAVPEAVRGRTEALVTAIVSADNVERAAAAVDALTPLLPTNRCSAVRHRIGGGDLESILNTVARRRAGLASPSDKSLLTTAEGRARIARAAARRYYSSPVPPLFSPTDDPFCLADGFVTSLPTAFSGWGELGGRIAAKRDGKVFMPVFMTLRPDILRSSNALGAFSSEVLSAISAARIAYPDVGFDVCGAPMHTAIAAARCKREIGLLTAFSVLFIAALCAFAFKSARWILPTFMLLVVAASTGGAVLMLAFREIHAMSLLFGTTTIGIGVDYAFHTLLADEGRRRETVRNLLSSFATTEIGLAPLALSSLPVLRQTAVFLAASLAGALCYALVSFPRDAVSCACGANATEAVLRQRRNAMCVAAAVALALAAFGIAKVRVGTSLGDLYRPPAELAASERLFSELSGNGGNDGCIITDDPSASLETLLGREAELVSCMENTDKNGVPALCRFMPPLESRIKTAELIAKLYEEHGARQAELLGLERLEMASAPEPWDWNDIPPAAREAFTSGNALLIPAAPRPSGLLPEGVTFYQPRETLSNLLRLWTGEALVRLIQTLVAILAVLLLVRGRAAYVQILPTILAIAAVAGAMGLTGRSVNLFHLLAFFLLAGMGIDYAIFLCNDRGAALKPALCSLLTSMAGFGALSFVSFPIASAFGEVLGIGLPVAFISALGLQRVPQPKNSPTPQLLNSQLPNSPPPQVEQCASPLGIEVLLLIYRIFGLRVLNFGASCVGWCAWAFSRGVRAASPSPRKVAAFARSLADKMVVLADGHSLPQVTPDDTDDMRAFLSDVAGGRGVFVLSSHCGTIEVLAALGKSGCRFHGWMDFDRTSIFNAIYLRHAKNHRIALHPISGFGLETVMEMGDILDSGDCIVMAADRGAGREIEVPFDDGEITLQEGAFRLAHALEHPVYFIACVESAPWRYRAVARRISGNVREMACAYAAAFHSLTAAHPLQWFRWRGSK